MKFLVCFKSNVSRNNIGSQKHFGFDVQFAHKLQTTIIAASPAAGFSRRKNQIIIGKFARWVNSGIREDILLGLSLKK